MIDVISTGKSTHWHSFPNLHTKCTYSHVSNELVDFQVVPSKNCFLEINKKFGFELLRTVIKNDTDQIQRIKKRQLNDVLCGATSKMYGSELALGLSTGFIRIFSVQSGEYMPIKLKPDRIGNSVIGLDYSNCDEYLAALYDSADINLYGLKTGVKTDVFRCDGASSTIRFHPAKRFALAVASYQGAITMLDIQSKKKLYFEKAAHKSPARDISMCATSPDIFMSCGYDCNINVYDLRKRSMVQQCTQPHPLSTICMSACGTFCVAGNLKGDVASFDFRKLNEPLDTKRVHEGGVVRVAFVPIADTTNSTIDRFADSINSSMTTSPLPTTANASQRESSGAFSKFVDVFHHNNEMSKKDSNAKRDSLLDLAQMQRHHDFSMDSVLDSPTRLSNGPLDFSELRLKRLSRNSLNQSDLNTSASTANRDSVLPDNNASLIEEEKAAPKVVLNPKRLRLTEIGRSLDLPEIEEETARIASAVADQTDFKETPTGKNVQLDNKENRQNNNQVDIESFTNHITENHVSTPNHAQIKPSKTEIDMNRLGHIIGEIVDQKVGARLNSLENKVIERINQTENEIKFYQEYYHNTGFKGNFNLFKLMEREIDMLKEGVAVLLRDDAVAQDYYRLKAENEELKQKLEKGLPN